MFDVRLRVPLKVLDTLVGLADDLEGVQVVSANPQMVAAAVEKAVREPAKFISSLDPAKKLILEKLKAERVPVPRRVLVKELRSKGFAKNSVGPLCSEMKRDGVIENPRRGYWSVPPESRNGQGTA